MRIVQVLLSPRIGGAEALVASLEAEWLRAGHESFVIYLDPEDGERGRLERLRHVRRELAAHDADVVLAHSYIPAIYARLARFLGPKVHIVLHSAADDYRPLFSRLVERILRHATASVIGVSHSQVDRYIGYFGSAVPTTVIRNGVGARFSPRDHAASKPKSVVTVARVAEQKRPEFWWDVVALVQAKHPEVEFSWWGPVAPEFQSDARFGRYAESGSGWKGPTNSVEQVLTNADLMFHPAAREAASITLLEAAVSGLPVIYADSLDRPSADEAWALRYPADSPSDAAEVIERALGDWDRIAEVAVTYAHAAAEEYGASRVALDYLSWFSGVNSSASMPQD